MAKPRTPRSVKGSTPSPSPSPVTDLNPDSAADSAAEPVGGGPLPLVEWVAQARALGLPAEQQVWQVHIVHGRDPVDAARLLDLSLAEVERLAAAACQARAESAPKSARERAILREMLWDMMLDTYAMTCGSTDPRLLTLRLKTMDQMADLHGLNTDPETVADQEKPAAPEAYSTRWRALSPEEREERQMAALREVWGCDQEVREIKQVMAQARTRVAAQGTG